MQGGTWAAALKKGLKPEAQAAEQDALFKNEGISPSDVMPGPILPLQTNPKAAARQKLLAEALKSRSNAVTGTWMWQITTFGARYIKANSFWCRHLESAPSTCQAIISFFY